MHTLFLILAVSLVAWGALSFGAVYPWAYGPLLIGSVAAGLLGMFMPGSRAAPLNRAIALSLALLVLAVVLQLVPVPRDVILWLNPEADAYLRQADLVYALQSLTGESVWHPLSIRPDRTLLGLAFLTAFGLLLLGTIRAFSVIRRRRFTEALLVFGVVLALVGIVQKGLMVDKPYGFWEPIDADAFFPFGPFVNRNHFAGWMLLALPLSLGHFGALVARGMPGVRPGWRNRLVWFSSRDASAVVLTGLGVLVISLSLVMTLSRSGLVCFSVALALLGGLWLRRNATSTRRALGVAFLGVLLIGAMGWTGIDAIASRLDPVQTDGFGGRLGAWADAVDIAAAFPVTGTGFSQGTSVFMKLKVSPEVFIVAGLAQVVFDFLVRLLILVPTFVVFRIVPPASALLFPLAVLCLVMLGASLGMLLLPLASLYSDVGRALTLAIAFWMYLSPVVYPPPSSGLAAIVIRWNPVTPVIMTAREWLTVGHSEFAPAMLLVAGASVAILVLSGLVLRVCMPHLVARMGM